MRATRQRTYTCYVGVYNLLNDAVDNWGFRASNYKKVTDE
jgi:hypothetical protein